jgi:hypothetical protein
MTRLITFTFLLFTSGLLFAQPQPDIWRTFKPDGGHFEVLSPGVMQHDVDSVETPLGQLAYHTYFYQPPESDAMAENYMYMVSYCDYPEGTLHQDSAGLLLEFFTATMESAAASVDGETVYHAERNYRSYPGHFWRIDYLNGQAVIKTWGIVVGSRYYALQTVTVKKRSLNRSSDNFLDSFRITPPEEQE